MTSPQTVSRIPNQLTCHPASGFRIRGPAKRIRPKYASPATSIPATCRSPTTGGREAARSR